MARKIRRATPRQSLAVSSAISHLREARDLLRMADAPRALARVRLALTSAEGAERHIMHRVRRTREATDL